MASTLAVTGHHDVKLEAGPKQIELLSSTSPTIVFRGGAGSGKTRGGVMWALHRFLQWPGARGMIVAATFPMLKQSVLVHLLELAAQIGLYDPGNGKALWTYNKTEKEIRLPWSGSTLWLRSADKPDSLLGADLAWLYGDEVALWKHDAFRYAVGRLRQPGFDQQDCYTFTPKGLNWAYEQLGSPREGLHIIQASTKDNPWASGAFKARLRREYGEGSAFYRQEAEGEFVAYEGLVYPTFTDNRVFCGAAPPCVEYVGGVDWGWTHPGVLLVLGVHASGALLVVDEVSETERDPDWWAEKAKELGDRYPGIKWFCDPSAPSSIEKFRKLGVNAEKANNEVLPGIAAVGGRFADGKLLVSAACTKLRSALSTYVWKKRAGSGATIDEPEKVNDHEPDALRYAVMGYTTRQSGWWQDKSLMRELYGAPLSIGEGADGYDDELDLPSIDLPLLAEPARV